MKKYIVITSIFEPTVAVKKFSGINDYNVIVVGDKKSPENYNCDNVIFLSADNTYGFELEKTLPFNHYSRKMLGYLYAMRAGADIIIDTDDDNIPYDNFGFPEFDDNFNLIAADDDFINIYQFFTKHKIWPRGLPLNYINKKTSYEIKNQNLHVGVWQGLADGDPDVDAIYRLTDNTPCYFDQDKEPLVLQSGCVCPFNTQNTAYRRELFELLYLPTTVSFRFTDILKGLIAQPLMWNENFLLGFTNATVLQERNVHDYMKDFESEIPCYLYSEKVVNIAKSVVKPGIALKHNLYNVYNALCDAGITQSTEMDNLDAWLTDCEKLK